ncbi:mate-domain-containing protein [Aspergillus insuetus]
MAMETTPLLPQQGETHSDLLWKRLRKRLGQDFQIQEHVDEILLLLRSSLPVILAYALQNSLQACSLLIVGRSSPENLATAAFSYMNDGLDTLASSAFTGSSDEHHLGVLLQRAFLVLGLMYIPITILWAYSGPLFLALGQDPMLAKNTARFLTCLIPGGLGYIYFEAMKKFLQAQGLMLPGIYSLLIAAPINAILNHLFCNIWQMGLIGAPFATSISYWICFFLLVLYSVFISGHQCWGRWSHKMFENLGIFTRLATLGVTHVGAEWWAFEIVAIAAGWLGIIPMSSQSIIMTTDQVLNTIPFGIGVAASARIGNLLGARDAQGAARAAKAAAYLSMLLGALIMTALLVSRQQFGRIFSSDEGVIRLTAEVMPYVAAFQIADGLNSGCGGCLRGTGRQHIGATINIVSYYCFALPLGIWLSFHGYGLIGLWIGQCLALYIVGVFEWALVSWSDWDNEVHRAFKRMDQDNEEVFIDQA